MELGAPKIATFEIMEWEDRFTLRVNSAKNTDYIKKVHCLEFNFLQKLSGRICLSISGAVLPDDNSRNPFFRKLKIRINPYAHKSV